MKILIVEDEINTAQYLKKGLEEHHFVVDITHNGIDGLHLAQNNVYSLVILDVNLPDLDGFSLIKIFRSKNKQTPVLFLTAKDEVFDKVKGLQLGADDYLVKPFHFVELLARINSLMRRGTQNSQINETIEISDLKIDFESLKAYRDGVKLDLTAKEFKLLSFLARNETKVVSRTMIAEQVWDINFDSDTNIVDVAIKRLRSKVDIPFDSKLIHTVRGFGYVLEKR